MKISLALLLTRDPVFEKTITEALEDCGAKILVRHDVDHALQIGCQRGRELDIAIIDRSDCHAITLVSAIRSCGHKFPIIIVTANDSCHCAALAYANGATACIAKSAVAEELRIFLSHLCEPKLELAAV